MAPWRSVWVLPATATIPSPVGASEQSSGAQPQVLLARHPQSCPISYSLSVSQGVEKEGRVVKEEEEEQKVLTGDSTSL